MQKSTFHSDEKIIDRLCNLLSFTVKQCDFTFSIYDENKTFLFSGGAPIVIADLRNMREAKKEAGIMFNINSKINAVNTVNHFLIEAHDLVSNYLSTTNYKIKNDGSLFAKDNKEINEILDTLKSSSRVFQWSFNISSNALQITAKMNYKTSSDRWIMYKDWVNAYDLKENKRIDNVHDNFDDLTFDQVNEALQSLPALEKQAQELKNTISKLKFLTVGI